VLTKDYETARIRIAFHPLKEEVANPAIQKDPPGWADVADLFSPNAKLLQITKAYVGVIEPSEDLDIEMVTET
jgi:hypothetical protein